jgi:hypothetical protein
MNIVQLESLTENELYILFYVVNHLSPTTFPPSFEYDLSTIKTIKHDMLIQKLLASEPQVKDEHKQDFDTLMNKLGVNIERNKK